ncbi:calcium-binding protein [Allosphingosinicella deserti]|uniref:calcium-binding protein n=1 Tax=Allosphingosinicella deserti TaxID=2116704 RepID=UPI000D0B51E4|nr:calcium-binding protein [Sphingomonas deserti]
MKFLGRNADFRLHMERAGLAYSGTDPVITGTPADDHLTGISTTSAQVLRGLAGDDYLALPENFGGDAYGSSGDDELHGADFSNFSGPITNRLFGEAGNDLLFGGNANAYAVVRNEMDGGSGNDTLQGGGRTTAYANVTNVMHGGAGEDRILGADGATNQAFGDAGSDVITGGNTYGGTGSPFDAVNDLHGGAGDDTITGGGGNGRSTATNTINGDAGNDTLTGGSADPFNSVSNTILGGAGNDLIKGGSASGPAGVTNDLDGGAGNDRLVGGDSDDVATVRNTLHGGAGNDVLVAGSNGGELFSPSAGNFDDLWGGAGNDTFVFRPFNHHDTIHDFAHGKDLIDLTAFTQYDELSDLNITSNAGNSIIDFGNGNEVTLLGVSSLNANDFVFFHL